MRQPATLSVTQYGKTFARAWLNIKYELKKHKRPALYKLGQRHIIRCLPFKAAGRDG